ncbi:hypothetical protein L0Y59_01220 [Candidatus Uhrbacteria bacterium]|nr:hypothetical protein [Candidatus Uhrbacteria bacterium]
MKVVRAGKVEIASDSGAVILIACKAMVEGRQRPEVEGCSPSDLYRDPLPRSVTMVLNGKRSVTSITDVRKRIQAFIASGTPTSVAFLASS